MIFQNAIWQYPESNTDVINKIMHDFKCNEVMARLYFERKLTTKEQVDSFLNPTFDALHDPMLMSDMAAAKDRIQQAIDQGESIWIYGDYDVDGITSIVTLRKYFEHIGHPANYYIPSRQDEGYGISIQGIDWIKSQGGQLIITVDCGITAVDQAAYAKSIGLDLIITDHHECQESIPEAVAVVNPKRGGYPFEMLAGCGVAFKLTQAMLEDDFKEFYPKVIDIVALGTVADIVPLVDENRIITKIGLEHMTHTSNPGIQALLSEANLTDKEVTAGHIGFVVAPRINASGRIGNPDISVDMLMETDYFKALDIAKNLSQLNSERQAQEREIMDEADRYIRFNIDLENEKILLVVGENWHTGIIGIVASKLTEKYSRPAIVLNVEDGMAKGSARSIQGISIFEILSTFKHFFDKFGGHEQAAGLSFKSENIQLLKEALKEYGLKHIPNYMLIASQRVSGILKPQMVTHQLVEDIESLKPFGIGNPKPQFVFENLTIDDYRLIGKGQNHLKMIVNDGVRVYDAIAFNKADWVDALRKSDPVHLLLNLEKNNFMGVETIQLLIQDLIKDKMPVKNTVGLKVHKSIYKYYKEGYLDRTICRNLELADIEGLLNDPPNTPLLIRSVSGMMKFKDYVLAHNITNYTLHFNHIDPFEQQSNYLDVVFMPMEIAGYQQLCFGSDDHLGEYIPNREDLVYFYKQVFSFKSTSLVEVGQKVRMSQSKILFCLELLKEMHLLEYQLFNMELSLKFLPKPEEKVNLDGIPLFQNMMKALERNK